MKLSIRLQMIADMVTNPGPIADIGTDHGWIPIYLVMNNRVNHALAMDIARGPLERAMQHICDCNLSDKIECRLSDGLDAVLEEEVKTAVIAGMGGDLIARIIQKNPNKAEELVVSPHTHSELVRIALVNNGYLIAAENACFDSEKYYEVIHAVKGISMSYYSEEELYFGPKLLAERNEILHSHLFNLEKKFISIPQKEEYRILINKALKYYN